MEIESAWLAGWMRQVMQLLSVPYRRYESVN
jgi:hypothetical protein